MKRTSFLTVLTAIGLSAAIFSACQKENEVIIETLRTL